MSTDKEEKAPLIEYALDERGIITRTDKTDTITVAVLKKDSALVLKPEWAKFRPAIVRWLNENDKAPTAVYLEGDEPSDKKVNIPPMPRKNPRLGDKTPAVVEWFKRYHTEQYRARYGIKGPGTVTKHRQEINPETGQTQKVPYEVEATIAVRKTHLTEKLDANDAALVDDEYDWGADQKG